MGPPLNTCLDLSLRVRSGLIACHVAPASPERNKTLPPTKTSLPSVGEVVMGEVQLKRYFKSDCLISSTVKRYGRMRRRAPVSRSTTSITPFCESAYTRLVLGPGTAY